ncbi:MAG: hypothetical protein IPL75_12920 [Acidobacteria bacterium]|nr:hypothetical protein [Acidobacteriota bacterium]
MPPSHSFWVILIGKTPTSFRAKEREDLVPTLRQLQRTQTDVTLRWFERGKVWSRRKRPLVRPSSLRPRREKSAPRSGGPAASIATPGLDLK